MKLTQLSKNLQLISELEYKKEKANKDLAEMKTSLDKPKESHYKVSELDIQIQEKVIEFLQHQINELDQEV